MSWPAGLGALKINKLTGWVRLGTVRLGYFTFGYVIKIIVSRLGYVLTPQG